MGSILSFLKHLFMSDDIKIGDHWWFYRISEGEYGWVASLTASPMDEELYDRFNPFAIYAFRVKHPRGTERYIIEVLPTRCVEAEACGFFVTSEARNVRELLEDMEFIAKNIDLYYEDPEEFFEKLDWHDLYTLSPSEYEEYKEIRPTPLLARKVVDALKRMKFVRLKHIPRVRE